MALCAQCSQQTSQFESCGGLEPFTCNDSSSLSTLLYKILEAQLLSMHLFEMYGKFSHIYSCLWVQMFKPPVVVCR